MKPGDLVRVIEISSSSSLGEYGIVIKRDAGPWRWWVLIEGEILSMDRRILEVINETR